MPILEVLAPMALQGATQAFNDWQVNRQNKELAQYSFKKNLQMWRMNNDYNSPVNQMARLKSAGLNPNLVYGNGAVANTSSKTPEYHAPDVQSTINPGNPLEHLERYQNTRLQQLQEANLAAQNKLIKNNAVKAKLEAVNTGIRSGILRHDERIRGIVSSAQQELTDTQVQFQRQQLTNAEKQQKLLEIDYRLKQIEEEWNKKGFTKADPVQFRMLAEAMTELGLEPADILRKFMEDVNTWRYMTDKAKQYGTSVWDWLMGTDNRGNNILGQPLR